MRAGHPLGTGRRPCGPGPWDRGVVHVTSIGTSEKWRRRRCTGPPPGSGGISS